MFGTTLPSRDWDLMLFAWVGSPASPITLKDIYGCGGDQNDGAYCNRALSKVLNKVSTTLDAAQRAKLLNEAELKYMVKDIPSIPMFARPLYMINAAKVKGVGVNPTQEGRPGTSPSGRPRSTRSRRLTGTTDVPPPPTRAEAGRRSLDPEAGAGSCSPTSSADCSTASSSSCGELPRLHVRDELRRPARGPADRPERLRDHGPERDRAQAPRRPDPRSDTSTGCRTPSRTSSARRCSTTGRSCPSSGA